MLIQADALYLPYPSNYFHAIVTSPPYWGLRKYAGEQGEEPLGLEATPERHIERMVAVFREVRRVLRDDGVVWLNYGDCFAGSGGENMNTGLNSAGTGKDRSHLYRNNPRKTKIAQGNLMLMPHRLAIALQADGWIVRNDLVWFKRNPMPESVAGWRWERKKERISSRGQSEAGLDKYENMGGRGNPHAARDGYEAEYEYSDDYVLRKSSWRHTRAHEYVFQLVKGMGYYCNQEVVREANIDPKRTNFQAGKRTHGINLDRNDNDLGERSASFTASGRNPRSVLDVPTAPYKGSHYATFPPKLIAPLIRASVPRRCCPECGMAWAPVVDKTTSWESNAGKAATRSGNFTLEDSGSPRSDVDRSDHDIRYGPTVHSTVTDYRPTCECGVTEHEPGIVLDIFGGSGTTGMVAKQLLRRWVVMDISRPYLDEQAKVRTGTGTPSKALEGLPMFEEFDG